MNQSKYTAPLGDSYGALDGNDFRNQIPVEQYRNTFDRDAVYQYGLEVKPIKKISFSQSKYFAILLDKYSGFK